MKKTFSAKKLFLSLYHYFCFFLFMAFLISCCMLLFLTTMSESMGITLNESDIKTAAILTFGNVVLLSLICTVIDALRRKIMIDRPVKQIVSAAERIAQGDYSVRIPPLTAFNRADGLGDIVDCYNKMAAELAGTESMRADFIASVSHELKTPLAVMENYGTLLQSPHLSEQERLRYAKCVTEASRRLSDLCTNILKLSKLENQSIYPTATAYDLSDQLCLCLLGFEDAWEKKELSISTDIADGVYIHADAELLSLVWNNLFSNAIKFTDRGGSVAVSLTADETFAIVTVSDTGCGISPDVGAHIFEKFYQGDTSRATEGNGLGLSLVRRIMDIVDGDISVESEVGRGSTFTVRIRKQKKI